jgi:hypothetical protein
MLSDDPISAWMPKLENGAAWKRVARKRFSRLLW